MFGQGPLAPDFDGEADFWAGAGVVGVVGVVGVDVVGVVGVVAGVVAVELVVAAEAPAMPATAPPVARAPATIVAWSILDIRIR
jgi:hypothetical protein